MLRAHFDESGKWKSQDFICLAGYLADDGMLEGLCAAWGRLLTKHRIPYVHTTDLMALRGPYARLGWTNDDKRKVIEEFASVVGRHINRGVAVGVDTKAYRALPKDSKDHVGDPAVFCFIRVLKLVMNSLREWGWQEHMVLMFDDERHVSPKCYSMYSEIKRTDPRAKALMAAITFADDHKFYPLQAADMIAYATMREQRRGDQAWDEDSWFSGILCAKDSPTFGREYVSEYWDAEALRFADRSSVTAAIDTASPEERNHETRRH